jgi:hypothetical protein
LVNLPSVLAAPLTLSPSPDQVRSAVLTSVLLSRSSLVSAATCRRVAS